MKPTIKLLIGAVLWTAILLQPTTLPAQGTAFTYQGLIQSNGVPVTGTVGLRPTLWDADTGGNLIAGSSPTDFLATLTNGLLTATLNFGGSAFNGQPRWLQWEINPGSGPFTALSPRQPVTPTPYAMIAGNVSGVIANSSLPVNPAFSGTATAGSFAGDGAGLTGLNASQLTIGTVPAAALGNAWKTTGNAGTTPGTHFLGTSDNQPLDLRVNNTRALRLQPDFTSPILLGGFPGNSISGVAPGSVIVGGGASNFTNSIVAAPFSFIGGGRNNQIFDSGDATIAGGAFNRIENAFRAAIVGGDGNLIASNAVWSFIGGGENNQILTNSGASLISGGQNNQLGPNATDSVLVGGIFNRIQTNSSTAFLGGGQQNTIYASDAVLVGGRLNEASATGAFLGGGQENRILVNSPHSAIVGGRQNVLGPDADYAFIGGGQSHNVAVGAFYSTIGGGFQNTVGSSASAATIGGGANNSIAASGTYATIPGGRNNSAAASAFAAGTRAKANHTGAFVWADSTDADFASTAANQFNLRANGGVRMDTGSGPGISLSAADTPLITRGWDAFGPTAPAAKQGHGRWGLFMEPSRLVIGIPSNDIPSRFFSVAKYHTNGTFTSLMTVDQNGAVTATSFTPTSDRNAKHRFQSVNTTDMLEKVVRLPLTRWQFKEDQSDAWHLGPMAQDFHTAFGLGANDTTIATVDADGVALAAIQGLNAKLESGKEKAETRMEKLEAENAELRQELQELKQMVRALTRHSEGGAK